MALQDRNETLFYRLLSDHLEELAPIVYTPTVGEACERFSHILRRPRGLWITPEDIAWIPDMLRHAATAAHVADRGDRRGAHLGLGDQGAGGMGIPVGKLSLYTAGAGIDPARTLPICLDCGTDNEDLLQRPAVPGLPQAAAARRRVRRLHRRVRQGRPRHLPRGRAPVGGLQAAQRDPAAGPYRHTLPSFNDDIQGTAVVVLAGILAAMRARQEACATSGW